MTSHEHPTSDLRFLLNHVLSEVDTLVPDEENLEVRTDLGEAMGKVLVGLHSVAAVSLALIDRVERLERHAAH